MNKEEIKDRLAEAVETDNPPGTDYYGAEPDEIELEAARERMAESLRSREKARHEAADGLTEIPVPPDTI